jgi:hypothetical protein
VLLTLLGPQGASPPVPSLELSSEALTSGLLTRQVAVNQPNNELPLTTSLARSAYVTAASEIAAGGSVLRLVAPARSSVVAPAGTVRRATSATKTGAVSTTGGLLRSTVKRLQGQITSSGFLSVPAGLALAFVGTVGPAGSLARRSNKGGSSSAASAGQIVRRPQLRFTSNGASAGLIRRVPERTVSGSTASTGSLARRTALGVSSTASSAGATAKQLLKRLTSSVAFSGVLLSGITYVVQKFSSAVGSYGVLGKEARRITSGSTTPVGGVARLLRATLSSSLGTLGALLRRTSTRRQGGVVPTGQVAAEEFEAPVVIARVARPAQPASASRPSARTLIARRPWR